MLLGFSEGSCMRFEEVLASQYITGLSVQEVGMSCGALAFQDQTGRYILGQTLDLGLSSPTCTAIVTPDSGVPFVAHLPVGTVWFGPGVNRHGLFCGGASVNARMERKGRFPFFLHP